jgi:hypothetical protein
LAVDDGDDWEALSSTVRHIRFLGEGLENAPGPSGPRNVEPAKLDPLLNNIAVALQVLDPIGGVNPAST